MMKTGKKKYPERLTINNIPKRTQSPNTARTQGEWYEDNQKLLYDFFNVRNCDIRTELIENYQAIADCFKNKEDRLSWISHISFNLTEALLKDPQYLFLKIGAFDLIHLLASRAMKELSNILVPILDKTNYIPPIDKDGNLLVREMKERRKTNYYEKLIEQTILNSLKFNRSKERNSKRTEFYEKMFETDRKYDFKIKKIELLKMTLKTNADYLSTKDTPETNNNFEDILWKHPIVKRLLKGYGTFCKGKKSHLIERV